MSTLRKIEVTLDAMAEMLKYDHNHHGRETAGLLWGTFEDGILRVSEIDVGEQEGNAVHVEISDKALADAAIKMSMRTDNKIIVGWWHTHPGLSSFMSSTDITTQNMYQNLFPEAIGIVFDAVKFMQTGNPLDLDYGIYQVRDNKFIRLSYDIIDTNLDGLVHILNFSQNTSPPVSVEINRSKVMEHTQIKYLRTNLTNIKDTIDEEDYNAISAWIDLADAQANGIDKEVAIESAQLNNLLNSSLNDLGIILEQNVAVQRNKHATIGFLATLIGVALETFIFIYVNF